jgi:hypothetical protein
MIDPMWEVAPTRAIAVTFTKFLLEPFEHIGRAPGLFVRAPLKELPVQMWPIALAFMFLVFILVLVMAFGYNIRLPVWFGLESSDRKHTQSVANMNKHMEVLEKYDLHTLRHFKTKPSIRWSARTAGNRPRRARRVACVTTSKSSVIKMMNAFHA